MKFINISLRSEMHASTKLNFKPSKWFQLRGVLNEIGPKRYF